ncbi:GntR family transcriptional regulator, phosphonate transport system regulatory protein [Roseovarius azorensis]|uniref:GntR family transcriptional regulator, phosphonate transport system regulatory protein n=1 Tax=Roseovarius azorensis TaxID=1287727 RepID=A0A1H7UCA6_9RHOB|nr:phosphonate metabolism transcriptional regulator PhnF [Roseovarius azorensis]SEL94384.1 GntR family transcriptional regulator, phosphonate transport system regulatory protein [Roseovarius azorensis]
MTREKPDALWRAIHDSLSADIAAGRYAPGDKLPTEAALATRFGVNRHTVRRALRALSDSGVIFTRRGAGAFVAHRPADYPIGQRVRFHQNLRAAGRLPAKEILALETRAADAAEAEALTLLPGAQVHVYDGLSLADGMPVAIFRSTFPAARFPDLPEALSRLKSVTAALAEQGVPDYTRASTRLNAKLASPTQALHLHLSPGAPILRTIAVNVDLDGQPIEYGRTWFAGDRITLILADL